jgi:ribosomal protein S18 acetylase RimI-like enzyme
MPPEPQIYLHVRPEVLPLVGELYDLPSPSPMMRMLFQGNAARGSSQPGVTRLGAPDLARLEELYADGHARSEGPGFFSPDMLARGVYFGMRDGDGLCAVAGTHLLAPAARAAAIGNIYTRFDCRGRGFGAATTAAVVEALAASGMTTIGLSVREDNTAAIRVYERLGFVRHCAFIEGLATRRGGG